MGELSPGLLEKGWAGVSPGWGLPHLPAVSDSKEVQFEGGRRGARLVGIQVS